MLQLRGGRHSLQTASLCFSGLANTTGCNHAPGDHLLPLAWSTAVWVHWWGYLYQLILSLQFLCLN